MATPEGLVTVSEAAEILNVTPQSVRRLVDRGDVAYVARGLVDLESVRGYLAVRQGTSTRVWSEQTAWAAIALLSGVDPKWVGPAQRSRLRKSLRKTDALDLARRTRNRAQVRVYEGHPSAIARVAKEVVFLDTNAILGLVDASDANSAVDGYLSSQAEEELIDLYALVPDSSGPITLRVTGFDLETVQYLAASAPVLAALDATTSGDPRQRGQAQARLNVSLAQFATAQHVAEARAAHRDTTRLRIATQAVTRAEKANFDALKRLARAQRGAGAATRASRASVAKQRSIEQRIERLMKDLERATSRLTRNPTDIRTLEQRAKAAHEVAKERKRLLALAPSERRMAEAEWELLQAEKDVAATQTRLAKTIDDQIKAQRRAQSTSVNKGDRRLAGDA